MTTMRVRDLSPLCRARLCRPSNRCPPETLLLGQEVDPVPLPARYCSRWAELANAWDNHADGRTYPFNDWHAAMADLGAGRIKDVARLAKAYYEACDGRRVTKAWGRSAALPLIEGFSAFWHGDYRTAVAHLHDLRFIANTFGGSHAQPDIIDWTLTEAAIRGNMRDAAEALACERLALKPHSPINRAFLRRAQSLECQRHAVA